MDNFEPYAFHQNQSYVPCSTDSPAHFDDTTTGKMFTHSVILFLLKMSVFCYYITTTVILPIAVIAASSCNPGILKLLRPWLAACLHFLLCVNQLS